MNTALRIVARIALVALAILFVLPFVGVQVSGGLGLALACAAGFEVACWIIGSAFAFVIINLGYKKENSMFAAILTFTGVWSLLLLFLSSAAPALLTVAGWPAALFGTVVLLIISGATTWRGKPAA
jgi:hypothetical protein